MASNYYQPFVVYICTLFLISLPRLNGQSNSTTSVQCNSTHIVGQQNDSHCDADYYGIAFEVNSNDSTQNSFSEYGLSTFESITFQIQIDCSVFSADDIPSLNLFATADLEIPMNYNDVSDMIDISDSKMDIFNDMDGITAKGEKEEVISQWTHPVTSSPSKEPTKEPTDKPIKNTDPTQAPTAESVDTPTPTNSNSTATESPTSFPSTDPTPSPTFYYNTWRDHKDDINWYNVWQLDADLTDITAKCMACNNISTDATTAAPSTTEMQTTFDNYNDTNDSYIPTLEPTSDPTAYPTYKDPIYIDTELTFSWNSEYTQFFPLFQNYSMTQMYEDKEWVVNTSHNADEDRAYQVTWAQMKSFNTTGKGTNSSSWHYNLVLFRETADWLVCLKTGNDDGQSGESWQSSAQSYYGFDGVDDEWNVSNTTAYLESNYGFNYSMETASFDPMIKWGNCNISSNDKCTNFKGRPNRFDLFFWYDDDVWTNSLALYQTLTEQAIEEAICDLWSETHTSDVLTPSDFYLQISYFFNFCLLQEGACPNYESENDNNHLWKYPSNISDNSKSYKMYGRIRTKESRMDELYDMLTNNANAERVMELIARRVVSDEGRPNFVIAGLAIGDTPIPIWIQVPFFVSIFVYCFVGFCTLFAIAGALHGFGYWGADCIRISGIVYFGLYTWDFYSDIVFDLSLMNYPETQYIDIMFWMCTGFIAIPWIANMISLSKYQNRWCKDDSIRERVYQWFVSWQRLTYALAAMSGSAFGTVELANSYVFGVDFFCMGLNERHLKKFNNNRLWSGIIAENIPQLGIQFWFLSSQDWQPEEGGDGGANIVYLAIISSSLSIGAALLDIYAAKKLFDVLKKDGKYVDKVSCSMFVECTDIRDNSKRLQISTYAFRDALAETLTTHPRSVEMHFPITTSNGFKMKFTVFSSKLQPSDIYDRLKRDAESELAQKIKAVWKLNAQVFVPTDKIQVEGATMSGSLKEPHQTNIANIEMTNQIALNQPLMQTQNEGVVLPNNYDENAFNNAANLAAQNVGEFSNTNGNTTAFDSQIQSLNQQIALNQYLMMKQMQGLHGDQNIQRQVTVAVPVNIEDEHDDDDEMLND